MTEWATVRQELLASPAGTVKRYEKASLPHPREAGATQSLGWPVGQLSDWRFAPESDCRGLHVHEFERDWAVHLDRVHPECSLLDHARQDAPQSLFVGGALLGAVVGAALSKRPLVGAGVGFLIATMLKSGGK